MERVTVRAEQIEDLTSGEMADVVLEEVESYLHAREAEVRSVTWTGPSDSRGRWVVVLDVPGVSGAALEMDARSVVRECGDDPRG